MGSVEGKLLEQLADGAVRIQCPHGGDPVTVLPTPGRKDPCPHRIYVHRCMKVEDATAERDLLLRLQDHRLAALYAEPSPQATRDPCM
eukprot:698357-Prorocentrum_lima.AAC.1